MSMFAQLGVEHLAQLGVVYATFFGAILCALMALALVYWRVGLAANREIMEELNWCVAVASYARPMRPTLQLRLQASTRGM